MQTIVIASIKRTTRCLIEWQLHTMVRPSEAAGTRWEEIDFDNQVWTVNQRRKLTPLQRPKLTPLRHSI